MKFEYGDDKISGRELMIAIASIEIAVAILVLPREVTLVTIGSDGWIPIVVAGLIILMITWLAAKLASRFPNETLLTYATTITGRPIAILITTIFMLIGLTIVTYEVRIIADISKLYLFDKTPIEVLSLSFLLIIVYAVSGSRAGILRLNVLFLPFIIVISFIVLIFNIQWMEFDNLLPVFQTDMTGYVKGVRDSLTSYGGFGIILFYVALLRKPEQAPKMAALGICIPVVLYLLFFFGTIAVFSHSSTSNLLYPTIELAKRVEIPGQIFQRFESVFFVIWTMAIFNTAVMAFDMAVMAFTSMFNKVNKTTMIFIFSPIIYFISMLPNNTIQVATAIRYATYFIIPFTLFTTVFLLIIAKIRGVKNG